MKTCRKFRIIESKEHSKVCLNNCQKSYENLVHREGWLPGPDGRLWRADGHQKTCSTYSIGPSCGYPGEGLDSSSRFHGRTPFQKEARFEQLVWIVSFLFSSFLPHHVWGFCPFPSDWYHTVSCTSNHPEAFYGYSAQTLLLNGKRNLDSPMFLWSLTSSHCTYCFLQTHLLILTFSLPVVWPWVSKLNSLFLSAGFYQRFYKDFWLCGMT
jgi:hypothetical protein